MNHCGKYESTCGKSNLTYLHSYSVISTAGEMIACPDLGLFCRVDKLFGFVQSFITSLKIIFS